MGYGVGSIALIEEQQVLKFPAEVIQLQIAYVVSDKVEQANDQPQMLDERRKSMANRRHTLLAQRLTLR